MTEPKRPGRGGRRAGAGRKPTVGAVKTSVQVGVRLTAEQAAYLTGLGGTPAEAIRALIDEAREQGDYSEHSSPSAPSHPS